MLDEFDPYLDNLLDTIIQDGLTWEETQAKSLEYILALMTPQLWMSLVMVGLEQTQQLLDVVRERLEIAPFLDDSRKYHERLKRQWEVAQLNHLLDNSTPEQET